ncbi:MAG: hypothetical protein JXA33_00105 [Anaerolineae bacterium]|nr:hypothetical protein [Anaerolineae bacterium]
MNDTPLSETSPPWTCARCGEPLTQGKIEIAYLGSAFPVDLWHCPTCGLVLIPEALALGRMLEVEKMLEDK